MPTVRNLIDNFSKLISDYNQHQSNKIPNFEMLNQLAREQKTKEHLESGIKIYQPKFENLKLDIEVLKAQKIKEKNQKMFPLKYSENLVERQLGEQKLAYSLLFFNIFKESPSSLLSKLQSMLAMKDYDSIYSLLDIIFLNIGNSNQDFKEIISFQESLNKELQLDEVENDLETLKNLEENIEKVLSALEAGIPYLLLNFQIQNMTDDQYFSLRNQLIERFGEPIISQIFSLQ